jgi:hypothetical protein
LVAALLRQLVGEIEQLVQIIGEMHFTGIALHLGQTLQCLIQLRAQLIEIGARLVEQRPHRSTLLFQHGLHEMQGLDVLMVAAHRQ